MGREREDTQATEADIKVCPGGGQSLEDTAVTRRPNGVTCVIS